MALSHPEAPELKRFTFFVSRRREDNRERFRLHMGYFATLAEAEEWLAVVRDIYPGAWAGEAPGKKLRARAAAAELAKQLPPPPTAANARVVGVTAQLSRSVAAPPPPNVVVPTLQAAPVAQAAKTTTPSMLMQPVLATAPAPATPPVQAPVARPAVASAQPASIGAQARAPANVAPSVPGRQPGAAAPAAIAGARPAAAKPAGKKAPVPDLLSASNVREVMAALDDTGGDTRQMQAPAYRPGAAPTSSAPSVARAAPGVAGVRAQPSAAPRAPVAEAPRAKAPVQPTGRPAADASATLSDTQVLRILENRRSDASGASDAASSGISLLKPDDTQTLQALKEAVRDNAPVAFAVQLYWSVQPVELDKVPPLAIFSAYTLYTVEGSREGRKWYGLRLGFFSDAISAKQVAYYVRSEFNSVAVVPVSPQEKARATAEENKSAVVSPMPKKKAPAPKVDEFKLFDDEPAPPPPPPAAKPPEKPAAHTAPRKKPLGRVRAREQRPPKTLEETLEILGASELEIDTGVEVLNDTGVRHLRVEVQKDTPFAKLLDRLTERVRRN